MNHFTTVFLACVLAHPALAADSVPHWSITLSDDSRIALVPQAQVIRLESSALETTIHVPLVKIRGFGRADDGGVTLSLENGDRVSGQLADRSLVGDTVFGRVEIGTDLLRGIEVQALADGKKATAGEFQVDYAGFRWDTWRTGWAAQDGVLASQRHVRPGFQYGHWANGRGGMAITGNGDGDWVDYEVAFDYEMLAANREFFHAHIPGETRGMALFFRARSLTESWNQPDTGYSFNLNPSGTWTVVAYDAWHMPGNGWGSKRKGKLVKLATGKAESCEDASEGRLRLRVEGNKIQVWLGEELLVDLVHDDFEIEPIPFGGFGFQWRYEAMGEISNLEVERL